MGRWMARLGGLLVLLALAATPAQGTQTPPVGTILTLGGPPLSLYGVDPVTGQRTVLSDLSNPLEGPTLAANRVAAGPRGTVVATGFSTAAGAQDEGVLVGIDPATGQRTLISDFKNPAQGPIGYTPFGVAAESSTTFLVTDRGQGGGGNGAALWRVSAGTRAKLSDFNNPAQGPLGTSPEGVALGGDGHIYVADAEAGSQCNLPAANDFCGGLFRVDGTTGQRTLVSDFGDPKQGPTGEDPVGLAFDPATNAFLVIDEFAGACGCGELFRVDPSTGARTLLSDFGSGGQGPTGGARPKAVAVAADGTILTDGCPGTGGHGAICRIDRLTGDRVNFGDFGDPGLGSVAVGPGGTLAFMSLVPQRRPTSTAVSCARARLSAAGTTSCTATVSDIGSPSPTAPLGTVAFSSSGVDAAPFGFAPGSCSLVASATPGVAACTVLYRPQSFGSLTISASYPGDPDHLPSAGSETLGSVRVPHATITSGPSGRTPSAPQFTYTSDVPGSTFRCRFDHQPLQVCPASGIVNFDLRFGVHTFNVYAVAPDGTLDPSGDGRTFDLEPETRPFSCSIDLAPIVVDPGSPFVPALRCVVKATCPQNSTCELTGIAITSSDVGRGEDQVWLNVCRALSPGAGPPDCARGDMTNPPIAGVWCNDNVSNTPPAFTCPQKRTYAPRSLPPLTSFTAACDAAEDVDRPGSGVLTCTAMVKIAPVQPIVVVGQAGGVGLFLPAAGALAVNALPGGPAADAARVRPHSAPAFAPVRVTVPRAGWVLLRLRLSRSSNAVLHRRHKLSLQAQVMFTPRRGKRIVRRQRLQLLLPACLAAEPPRASHGRIPKRAKPPTRRCPP